MVDVTVRQSPRAPARQSTSPGGAVAAFVGLLWLLEIADTLLANRLDSYGIRPLVDEGLIGIAFAPLLHVGFGHLISNTLPLLVLGYLIAVSGVRTWVKVTAIVWIVGGLGTWLTGGPGTIHLGASVLVFGWLSYLLVVGFLTRRPMQIAIGVVVFLLYGGALLGVLPGQPGVSWQGHLFGAIGGVIAARSVASSRPKRRTVAS